MSIRQHLVRMGVPPHRHRLLQQTTRRTVSEYAPPPPSPNDLKAPLPEKFSLGKNNKLQVECMCLVVSPPVVAVSSCCIK